MRRSSLSGSGHVERGVDGLADVCARADARRRRGNMSRRLARARAPRLGWSIRLGSPALFGHEGGPAKFGTSPNFCSDMGASGIGPILTLYWGHVSGDCFSTCLVWALRQTSSAVWVRHLCDIGVPCISSSKDSPMLVHRREPWCEFRTNQIEQYSKEVFVQLNGRKPI